MKRTPTAKTNRTRECPIPGCGRDIGEHRYDINLLTGGRIILCPQGKANAEPDWRALAERLYATAQDYRDFLVADGILGYPKGGRVRDCDCAPVDTCPAHRLVATLRAARAAGLK